MPEALSCDDFLEELARYKALTDAFLLQDRFRQRFAPAHLHDAVYSYLERPAKRLRPAVLLMSCELFGGDTRQAAPAAAAVELFHTWTLVHDDIIDNDDLRRGQPTVHRQGAARAAAEYGADTRAQKEYGRDLAILAGDLQHGWALCMLFECARAGVPLDVVAYLAERMDSNLLCRLIEGEMLDVQFSHRVLGRISEEEILRMLELKTGVLLEYAAVAGACIGLGTLPEEDPRIASLGLFARKCGVAFQLQDDILGVTGNEEHLGKPIGSDLREGKCTTIVLKALERANARQTSQLENVLGNQAATAGEVADATQVLAELGTVDYTRQLAERFLREAIDELFPLPDGRPKHCLRAWADFMLSRNH
ncbi:MAG: polyprenyl synthetase family protein [Lentisphaeria bacterium]|nr:polyprenyl synthetase family protein [Lentisphaeria bacterium]